MPHPVYIFTFGGYTPQCMNWVFSLFPAAGVWCYQDACRRLRYRSKSLLRFASFKACALKDPLLIRLSFAFPYSYAWKFIDLSFDCSALFLMNELLCGLFLFENFLRKLSPSETGSPIAFIHVTQVPGVSMILQITFSAIVYVPAKGLLFSCLNGRSTFANSFFVNRLRSPFRAFRNIRVKTEPIGMVESPAIPNFKGFPSLHL